MLPRRPFKVATSGSTHEGTVVWGGSELGPEILYQTFHPQCSLIMLSLKKITGSALLGCLPDHCACHTGPLASHTNIVVRSGLVGYCVTIFTTLCSIMKIKKKESLYMQLDCWKCTSASNPCDTVTLLHPLLISVCPVWQTTQQFLQWGKTVTEIMTGFEPWSACFLT